MRPATARAMTQARPKAMSAAVSITPHAIQMRLVGACRLSCSTSAPTMSSSLRPVMGVVATNRPERWVVATPSSVRRASVSAPSGPGPATRRPLMS